MTNTDKLQDDPIVETVLEIRFEAPDLREVVAGRLSVLPSLQAGTKIRLPTADIPEPIRTANPLLLYQPTIEVTGTGGIGKVRIGGNVLSLHFLHPYDGWENVFPRIAQVIDDVFEVFPALRITRIGLRYVNVFTRARHHVESAHDLAISVQIADAVLNQPFNVTFQSVSAPDHQVLTRVVSKEFLTGHVSADVAAAIDIDIFKDEAFGDSTPDAIKNWTDAAHTVEKQAFRRLLPDDLYSRLLRVQNASA